MNVNTGTVYKTYDNAIEAGEQPADLVTGPPDAIRKLSRMVARNKRNARRKAKREMSAASRRRNR